MNKDLTVGKPSEVLWHFCLPLFGSIIFQQLYNIADSLVAGKFIGENALASVGNSYEITLIFIAFAFGCNIGCSVIVSQLFGSKKFGQMKTAIHTTFISGCVLCIVLMSLGFLFCGSMLELIHTPEILMSDSLLYLRIYILGFPFLFFYNVATGVFSALGDSKTPFIFLAVSSTANIIVDIIFVKSLHMGVSGVAWATFLCQGVSCILSLLVIYKRLAKIELDEEAQWFSFRLFIKISYVAIPSILQQSFISIGNIIIQSIINGFGPGVIAGYSASVKLNNLVITSFTTLGNGISNYTAQNIGANKLSRIKEGFRAGLRIVWILCIPFVLLYFFAGHIPLRLFMESTSGTAVSTGIEFLKILSPFYIVVSMKLVADGILRGSEMMKQFMIATFTDLILRVVLAAVLSRPHLFGSTGIWMAWPIGWIIATVISLYFYHNGPWNKVKKYE